MSAQGRRNIWKSGGGEEGYVVGIIYPLIEKGLTYLPKSGPSAPLASDGPETFAQYTTNAILCHSAYTFVPMKYLLIEQKNVFVRYK